MRVIRKIDVSKMFFIHVWYPYIFHFVHPLVKTAEIMVQRVNFERNLKNICPATVSIYYIYNPRDFKNRVRHPVTNAFSRSYEWTRDLPGVAQVVWYLLTFM